MKGTVSCYRKVAFGLNQPQLLPLQQGQDLESEQSGYLHAGVSSSQRLHGPPAPLRLVMRSVVGLGLHLDPQLVRS